MKRVKVLSLVIVHFLIRYWQKFITKQTYNSLLQVRAKNLFVVLLAGAGIWFVAFILTPQYRQQNMVSEGIIGSYTLENLPLSVTSLLSEPLVRFDASGSAIPNLAEGWQVNNDATVYTFTLKDNLYWSDGTKIKASDIKLSLPNVEISYVNDRNIRFKLMDSFSPFPSLLASPIFKNSDFIGVGKFKVSQVEVDRNNFVAKLLLTPTTDQTLPMIRIRFYDNEKKVKTAFELGEIDSIIGFTEGNDLQELPLAVFRSFPSYTKLTAIFYNTKDPILSDKNLRRALNCALPKVKGEERAKTSIPTRSWAYNPNVKECVDNQEMAQAYLDKVQSGADKTLVLTTTPTLSHLGDQIIAAWKNIGISAVLRVESGLPQNFQALLISQSIPVDPDQYMLWHSTQTKTNLSRYDTNKRVDKDLEDGRKTSHAPTREEKYGDFQKVLIDDAPAGFLYFPKVNVVFRKRTESLIERILEFQLSSSS